MLIEYVSDCCVDKTSKGFVNMLSFEIIKGVEKKNLCVNITQNSTFESKKA